MKTSEKKRTESRGREWTSFRTFDGASVLCDALYRAGMVVSNNRYTTVGPVAVTVVLLWYSSTTLIIRTTVATVF